MLLLRTVNNLSLIGFIYSCSPGDIFEAVEISVAAISSLRSYDGFWKRMLLKSYRYALLHMTNNVVLKNRFLMKFDSEMNSEHT